MENNHKMDTLSECMGFLREKGFKDEFKVENGKMICDKCDTSYSPQQVKINQFYRFEGESDPADMTVLYAIETDDGKKGMITDGFGTYADSAVSDFLKKIEEIHKKDAY